MKITVIGATGATGRHVVTQGIQRGHQITAFTRRPQPARRLRTRRDHERRRPRPYAVRKAITGSHAVIAIIGASSRKGPHQTADVARNLITTMSQESVARLIITSAYPLVADKPRLALALVTRIFADTYADATAMEQLVSASDLQWTIARPTRLTNRRARGRITISRELLDKAPSITRADLATALLNIAEDPTLKQTAVNLAGA